MPIPPGVILWSPEKVLLIYLDTEKFSGGGWLVDDFDSEKYVQVIRGLNKEQGDMGKWQTTCTAVCGILLNIQGSDVVLAVYIIVADKEKGILLPVFCQK